MSATPATGSQPASAPLLTSERRAQLGRRAQLLAGTSVAYNAIEAVVAIGAGAAASSIALIGFGLDSIVEMSSGLVILWQFRHPMPETRERRALRLIAFSFFALAGYVAFESVRSLIGGDQAESSTVGIVIAALSLVIMPLLSWGQRRTGQALGSTTVVADSKQTLLCTYLSAVLLVGLLLNATVGWWWADPLVGLVVAGLAVREGREAWRGESCTCIPAVPDAIDGACDCAEGGCPT
ncbi:MAG: cation transporter [Actinomycetes bacterium]